MLYPELRIDKMPGTVLESESTLLRRTCLACGEEVDLKTAIPVQELRESSRISIDRLGRGGDRHYSLSFWKTKI